MQPAIVILFDGRQVKCQINVNSPVLAYGLLEICRLDLDNTIREKQKEETGKPNIIKPPPGMFGGGGPKN